MPLSRRGLLEAAGAGVVGGYALPNLVPTVWLRVGATRHTYPIRVRQGDDPYEVALEAYRGGPGGETLAFERDVSVEARDPEGPYDSRIVGELSGRHRLVVTYDDGTVLELFTDSEYGACSVEVYPPGHGDLPPSESARVTCAV